MKEKPAEPVRPEVRGRATTDRPETQSSLFREKNHFFKKSGSVFSVPPWLPAAVQSWKLEALLVSQGFDRVEPGSFNRREEAEEDTDACGEADADGERPPRQ